MFPEDSEIVIGVSEFVALLNQTFDYAYPNVTITGELANLRVSKGKWLYFDLKDDNSSVKFFGTVYQLPGPLEDGMLLKVRGTPHLHNLYGFSVSVSSIQPTGEGAIKRAAELLKAKLAAEGLFDDSRKRPLPYPPQRIGLITSSQSAAYADFIKILSARWRGLAVELIDVHVQGEVAVSQIVDAVEQFNVMSRPPEVLIIVRGGGSPDDLAAFNTEQVTRAIAASRVPTLVAIGHEVDVSLAELVADRRASTPSNAAELLVPDRAQVIAELENYKLGLNQFMQAKISNLNVEIKQREQELKQYLRLRFRAERERLRSSLVLLQAFDPKAILQRGYSIVRVGGKTIRRAKDLKTGELAQVQLNDGYFNSVIKTITFDKTAGKE